MKKVSKKMILVLLIRNAIMIIALVGSLVACALSINDMPISVTIIWGILVGLLSLFLLIYPSLYFKRYSYLYDNNRVYISFGVLFHHQIVVPICQFQDIHLFQGPVMQIFHLHALMVSTAGSNFTVQFMEEKDAKKMLEDLEALIKEKHPEEQVNEEVL